MLMYSNKSLTDFMTFYFFSFSDFFSVDAMPLTQLDKILYKAEFLSTYHLESMDLELANSTPPIYLNWIFQILQFS